MSSPLLSSQQSPQYSVWNKNLFPNELDIGFSLPNTEIAPQLNKYNSIQQQSATNFLNNNKGSIDKIISNMNNSLTKDDSGFLSGYGEAAGNWLKQNPMAPVAFGLQLWQGINNYNATKKYLNQQQDLLNLQKQAYQDNKARTDEQYSIWKNARAGSSL